MDGIVEDNGAGRTCPRSISDWFLTDFNFILRDFFDLSARSESKLMYLIKRILMFNDMEVKKLAMCA